jgi:hypothetical protein
MAAAHFGHFTFRPASSSGALMVPLQLGQLTVMGMNVNLS